MKTTFLRTLLALGALMTLTSFATAQQRRVRDFPGLWSGDATRARPILESSVASYVDGDVMEEMPDAKPPSTAELAALTTTRATMIPHETTASAIAAAVAATCGSCDGCSCDGCGSCDGCCAATAAAMVALRRLWQRAAIAAAASATRADAMDYCGDCSQLRHELRHVLCRDPKHVHASARLERGRSASCDEKYEWSPRIVLGYESAGGLGGRMRWWNYSRTTQRPSTTRIRYDLDLDVLDAEGTARFSSKRADLVIAGGFRYADFEIAEDDDESCRRDAGHHVRGRRTHGDLLRLPLAMVGRVRRALVAARRRLGGRRQRLHRPHVRRQRHRRRKSTAASSTCATVATTISMPASCSKCRTGTATPWARTRRPIRSASSARPFTAASRSSRANCDTCVCPEPLAGAANRDPEATPPIPRGVAFFVRVT